MATSAAEASWLMLVLSSAVISAAVNVSWSALQTTLDLRREKAEEKKRIGHVYLEVALQLESFARRCDAHLYDVANALHMRREMHNDALLGKLKPVSFSFSPEPNWQALPIAFTAKIKTLCEQYSDTHEWISNQFQLWADIDEAYLMGDAQVAHYGLIACTIASDIRHDIGADEGGLGNIVTHFKSVIDSQKKRYLACGDDSTVIPELRSHFEEAANAAH